MSFAVSADAYDRFMGRYSSKLAPEFADFGGVSPGQRVLDVGCGPGALTAELVQRLGSASVTAVDPSETFVAAVKERYPEVEVVAGSAERLDFADNVFDGTLAQLVVHFMAEPIGGIGEMARVTRPRGPVAACVWDHAGGRSPLSVFWQAAHELDPDAQDESELAGAREGHLSELFDRAGLSEIEETAIPVTVEHPTFDEWWEPFTLGVGPAGAHTAELEPERRAELREACRRALPPAPFTVTASAWAARGVKTVSP